MATAIGVILCEKCKFSDRCMELVPCKKYEPEQSSNFIIDASLIQFKIHVEELSYS